MLFETAENLQGERQKEVWILPPVHVSVYGGGSQIKIVSDITATSIREVAAAIRSSWLHDAPRSSSLALYSKSRAIMPNIAHNFMPKSFAK